MPDIPSSTIPAQQTEIQRAFAEKDRADTLHNIRIGCYLGMALMPAGTILDYYVYPHEVWAFVKLRLLCSGLIGFFLWVVVSSFGNRFYRELGVVLAMFPTFFIALMIGQTDGPDSPYYAGLNLVLLVVGFVLHWTFRESLAAFTMVLLMYLGACWLNIQYDPAFNFGVFVNNLYFLGLTGVIIVTGNFFQSQLREREFSAQFELKNNQRMLEETNQRLLELDRVKSRFFANISHELRTPLTLLLAPLEFIMGRPSGALGAEAKQMLSTMHANGMRLLKLINDLLDLVRLDSGKMYVNREPVDVGELARGVCNAVRRVAEDKKIRLVLTLDSEVGTQQMDRDKIERILLNLLFNAVKFTPAGGSVELQARQADGWFTLSVIDTGVGIAPDQLQFVFDRFWQADTSSHRKNQGAGLGLALVKELTEVQGGTVDLRSDVGKGTRLTIRIPSAPAKSGAPLRHRQLELGGTDPTDPALPDDPSWQAMKLANSVASPAAAAGEEEWVAELYRRAELFPAFSPILESIKPVEVMRNGEKSRVLVADDEPDMLRFLKSQLQPQCDILEAVDGQQAIEKASQFLPDLILLDMMMPEKDGLEVCRELRARVPTQAIPVVILTARADEETKLAALSAGANDFLSKPFSTTELLVRVRNLIETHQSRQKLARQKQVLEATLEQLKETEAELVQSEKLASLGRMSAGIIHEINNPLNYAKTNLFALKSKFTKIPESERDALLEILKDVEDGVGRVQSIVSDLKTFTHPKAGRMEWVEVEHLVSLALRFLSNQLRNEINVRITIPEEYKVMANQNQIIQVLVNLLQNAIDAIKSKKFEGELPWIEIECRPEGKSRSFLIIRDNGPGIPQTVLPKIFDPFFTTKDVGEGLGLGLSICYRIMVDHGGRIHVRGEPGKPTEFAMEFPTAMCSNEAVATQGKEIA